MESAKDSLEVIEVSRKTPGDGKIEVSPATAARLEARGAQDLSVVVERPAADPSRGIAIVSSMRCTCARAARSGEHEHRFLESALFRDLTPGARVALELARDGELRLRVL